MDDFGLGLGTGMAGIGAMTDDPASGGFGPNGPPASYGPTMMAASASAMIVNAKSQFALVMAQGALAKANTLLKNLGLAPVPEPLPNRVDLRPYSPDADTLRQIDEALTDVVDRARAGTPAPTDAAAIAKNLQRYLELGGPPPPVTFDVKKTIITPSGAPVANGVPYNPNSKIPLPDPNDPLAVAGYNAARAMEDSFLKMGATPTEARVAAGDASGTAAASAALQQKLMIGGGAGLALAALWIVMNRRR